MCANHAKSSYLVEKIEGFYEYVILMYELVKACLIIYNSGDFINSYFDYIHR